MKSIKNWRDVEYQYFISQRRNKEQKISSIITQKICHCENINYE